MAGEGAAGGPNPVLSQIWSTAIHGITHDNPNANDVHGVKHRTAAAVALGLPQVSKRESAAFWYAYEGRQLNSKQLTRLTNLYTRAGLPLPTLPGSGGGGGGGGGSPADYYPGASVPYSLPVIYARGPRSRGRKRKKKRKLRTAAELLAARVLQTGEAAFDALLQKARGATRYVEPEFERLLKKVPSEFERILYRTPDFVPGAARTAAGTVARTAATVAGSAAAVLVGVLYPSTIGREPPWAPPTRTKAPPPQPPASPAPRARVLPAPSRPTPRPLPRTESRPSPSPAGGPSPAARPLPAPTAAPAPVPSPRPPSAPAAAPRPNPVSWSSWLTPFALGISARQSVAKFPRGRVVPTPQRGPLTMPQAAPLPSGSNCDCSKPTRTKRERKKRCTNPIINRSRKGDTITITRRIKCPA